MLAGGATVLSDARKASVLVLNYNGCNWLGRCLSSIRHTEYPNMDVCLIDNGSLDGSVEYVKENFPDVKIIPHGTNLGFAEGYNRAMREIKTEYVVLLNNDTEILNPRWLRSLIESSKNDHRIAAIACKMRAMNDPTRIDSVGGMGIPGWRGFVDIGKDELDRGQYDVVGFEPFSFCGGAVLMRREVFEEAGGFDPKFFMYLEDADLSWRLRLLGYRIGFAPDAVVAHAFSGTAEAKQVDARKLYYCHRNLLRSILKNAGSSLRWAVCRYALFSIMMMGGSPLLLSEPLKSLALVRAILWNLFNLKDTLLLRRVIQAKRKVSEIEILRVMYPRTPRYQPSDHPTLRHILDALFGLHHSISDCPR